MSETPVVPVDQSARTYATDPRHHVVLEASAGTGKTRVLVDRYLALMAAGVDPRHVLAITFTRKAAAEMRDRIVTDLQARHPGVWQSLRDRADEIAVSTIDAFCFSLLREFPLEAGLDPGFTLADETEVARLVEMSLDRTLRECRDRAPFDDGIRLVLAQMTLPRLAEGLRALLERRFVAPAALRRYLGRQVRQVRSEAAAAGRARQDLRLQLEAVPGGLAAWMATAPADSALWTLFRLDLTRLIADADAAADEPGRGPRRTRRTGSLGADARRHATQEADRGQGRLPDGGSVRRTPLPGCRTWPTRWSRRDEASRRRSTCCSRVAFAACSDSRIATTCRRSCCTTRSTSRRCWPAPCSCSDRWTSSRAAASGSRRGSSTCSSTSSRTPAGCSGSSSRRSCSRGARGSASGTKARCRRRCSSWAIASSRSTGSATPTSVCSTRRSPSCRPWVVRGRSARRSRRVSGRTPTCSPSPTISPQAWCWRLRRRRWPSAMVPTTASRCRPATSPAARSSHASG